MTILNMGKDISPSLKMMLKDDDEVIQWDIPLNHNVDVVYLPFQCTRDDPLCRTVWSMAEAANLMIWNEVDPFINVVESHRGIVPLCQYT